MDRVAANAAANGKWVVTWDGDEQGYMTHDGAQRPLALMGFATTQKFWLMNQATLFQQDAQIRFAYPQRSSWAWKS